MAEENAVVENQEAPPEAPQEGLLADAMIKAPPEPGKPEETVVAHIANEGSEEPTERPEWLLEKYQTPEDQAKAYVELNKKFSQGKHKVPENDYDLSVVKEKGVPNDDPIVQKYATWAKEAGISQEHFDQLASTILENAENQEQEEKISRENEMNSLGPQAQELLNEQVEWARKLVDTGYWGEDDFAEFKVWGGTAAGIRALRSMRRFYADVSTIPTQVQPEPDALPSKEECYQMVADEKYQTDPAYRQKVENIFSRVFGTKPDHRQIM